MADEEQSTGLADFGAGVVGIIVTLISMFILSMLMSGVWSAVLSFALGSALSWITYKILMKADI